MQPIDIWQSLEIIKILHQIHTHILNSYVFCFEVRSDLQHKKSEQEEIHQEVHLT